MDNLRIVQLRTENFMGIKLVEMTPEGEMVVIGGQNGQGKTSLIDSIECAIRGKKYHPSRPIRDGAESGEITLDLGDLKIRRRFTPGGGTISVERADGFKAPKPQEVLDSLAGAISFDPLEFARMDAKERLGLVRTLAGVDTREIEERRREAFEIRTDVNRSAKTLQAQLEAMEHFPDAPTDRVEMKDLLSELDRAQDNNAERVRLNQSRLEAQEDVDRNRRRIEQLKADLSDAETDLVNNNQHLADIEHAFDAMTEVELEPIRVRIAEVEVVNSRIDANARHAGQAEATAKALKEAEALTSTIRQLDEQKAEMIESASLPVPGLSFSESDGVTLDGIPFEQRSSAEKLDASVRIGMALNPKLHVMLVRDGCVLDDDAMTRLAEVAAENEYQLFVERVGTTDAGAIVISEGEILSQEDAA